MKRAVLLVILNMSVANVVTAETLEAACSRSQRAAANGVICGCIQDVADLTLNDRDQRLAVSFFKDPQKAQDMRQSDRRGDEKFWDRYKQFASAAGDLCQ